jgi:peptidoglycan hydrolase-like protein with peptidoglycan-binding domain
MWQYTSCAALLGISGDVDKDYATQSIFLSQSSVPVNVTPRAISYPTLRYGDTGESIVTLQSDLNKVGYWLVVDGQFGERTQGAVISFQSKSGLDSDGIVGPLTWTKLNQALCTSGDSIFAVQHKINYLKIAYLDEDGITGPCTQSAVRTFEAIEGLTVDSGVWGGQCDRAYSAITSMPTLTYGSSGESVRYLQARLGINYDGTFGSQTLRAVKIYQSSIGLYPDGIVGPQTWSNLLR